MEHHCLVAWPVEPAQAVRAFPDLPAVHACMLPAGHVRQVEDWHAVPIRVVPHRCHCGSWAPVRDPDWNTVPADGSGA